MAPSCTARFSGSPHLAHEASTVSMFREDPESAAEYLNQVLADGTREEFLVAMCYLVEAFGGFAGVPAALLRSQNPLQVISWSQ